MKKWNNLSVNMKRLIITLFAVPVITGAVAALANQYYNVDQDTCLGCGVCWSNYPESFHRNDEGKAEANLEGYESQVKQAQGECPVGAIWTNF